MSKANRSAADFKPVLLFFMIAPPVAFLLAKPFLRTQPDELVYLISGLASFSVISSAFILAIIADRRADEWSRSNSRFSTHWGYVAGASFLAMLLALPPFRDAVTRTAQALAEAPIANDAAIMVFTLGFMATVFAQMIFMLIMAVVWRMWMSRPI